MPTYEYRCPKCQENFSISMAISDHGKKKVVCPKCGGRKVERQMSAFHPVTSKKS